LIDSYVVKIQISTHVLSNIALSTFSAKNSLHIELAKLSKLCHSLAEAEDMNKLHDAEEDLDGAAGRYWNLTKKEIREMRRYVAATGAETPGTTSKSKYWQ
jgi:hypothetical protein